MRRHFKLLLYSMILCFAASTLAASPASAQQSKRAEDSWFIRAGLGGSIYSGERDFNPDNDLFDEDYQAFPSLLFEFGNTGPILFFNRGLALTYQGINNDGFDRIFPNERTDIAPGERIDDDGTSDWRHFLGLTGRIGFNRAWRIDPYVQLGVGTTFGEIQPLGEDSGYEFAFSPLGGIGLDLALTKRIGIFGQATGIWTFPDDAIDNRDGELVGIDQGDDDSFDFIGTFIGGLRINFKSAFTPVEVLAVDGPSELLTTDEGTFTATVNEEQATPPVEYRWEFGDGTTGSGLLATHSYGSPGEYTVTFTAINGDNNTSSESLTVTVNNPPVPAEIVTLNANPNPVTEGESVSFSANVRGDSPLTYNWDFGDGETGSGASPTHTYDSTGTYTVELMASNEFGEDTRTLQVEVEPDLPAICQEVSELNSAFFGRNSSTLTAEARSSLQENLDILSQCTNLSVRVEGYAAPGERNPDELSSDRARAVAQFYEDNEIASSRINARGMGQVRGVTSKKGGTSQFRRVDSIPVRNR